MFGNSPFGFSGSGGGGGGGTIGGGGTLNYLCKFTPDGTNIGNSLLFDNGTSVGLGTITPSASAILDLTSTSQGFLTPRMTQTQRNSISTPALGLFIFNTTSSHFNFWDGATWQVIQSSSVTSDTLSQVLAAGNTTGGLPIIMTSGDTLNFSVGSGGTLNSASTASIRSWLLPDASGTIALTSNIPSTAITLNVIPKGTGTGIIDGTWQFSTNDIIPITTGSNIGDATHRIGTIFMASIFDYTNDLTWVNTASTKMTLSTAGNLGIGVTSSSTVRVNIQGSDSTSSNFALQILNSSTANLALFRNDGIVNIGNATTTNQRLVRIGQNTAIIDIGSLVGTTAQGAMYLTKSTPSSTNYSISADSSGNTYVNAENGFSVQLRTNNVTRVDIGGTFMSFTAGVATTSALVPYTFTTPASTNQTASTETIGFRVNMSASIQHATGALTTHRDFVIDARTHSFVGASTITTAATLAISAAPIAGTNATITNGYALWLQSGSMLISSGALNITTPSTSNTGASVFTSSTALAGANSQNPTGMAFVHSGTGFGSTIYYGIGVQNRSSSALSAGMGVGLLMGLGYGGGSFINTKITSYSIGAVSSTLDSAFGIQTSISGTVSERFTFYKESFGINTTTPNSYFQVNGSLSTAYVAKTADYTLTSLDYTVDCTTNTFNITLPTAVGITGRIYAIHNSGTGVITLLTTSAQTIDGSASGALTLAQNKGYLVQSNGANWIIIAAK